MKDPAYRGTAENPVVLSGTLFSLRCAFRDLADTDPPAATWKSAVQVLHFYPEPDFPPDLSDIPDSAVQLPHGDGIWLNQLGLKGAEYASTRKLLTIYLARIFQSGKDGSLHEEKGDQTI